MTSAASHMTRAQTTNGHNTGLALLSRSGGAYIPPAKLKALQAQITDKSSDAFQRMSWESLKKSINGLINRANVSNIKTIIPDLINENLIRGRGLFCRSIIKSQAAALPFTPVYAALTSVLNTKFPQLGELLIIRLVLQFRRAYRRNDKLICHAATRFLAHLVNQRVSHEFIVLQILTLLLERPTDDSIEVAVALSREVGAYLTEAQPRALNAIFDRFRTLLHEAKITVRTQYMIEVLFQIRKDKFKDHPVVHSDLDLVELDDQITHMLSLDADEELDPLDATNVYKFDPEFLVNEAKYLQIKTEILGSDSDESSDADDSTGSEDESNQVQDMSLTSANQPIDIVDETGRDVMDLRKTIYLIIMSSLDFEECIHKLMRVDFGNAQHVELVHMIIDCSAQERTYKKFYGLMAERLCKLNRMWSELFHIAFTDKYETIHRYETTQLRNVAHLFAHLLATDAIGWGVLECVVLTEDTTTSSSRIFVKILFTEIMQDMGLPKLVFRLTEDPVHVPAFHCLFPRDSLRNARFAINYWTSIGLGVVTRELRDWLATAPPPPPIIPPRDSSDDSSSEEDDSSSDEDSDHSPDHHPRYGSRRPLSPEGNYGSRRHQQMSDEVRVPPYMARNGARPHDQPLHSPGFERGRQMRSVSPSSPVRRRSSRSRSPYSIRHRSPADPHRPKSRSHYSARRSSPPPGSYRPRSRSPYSTCQKSISPTLHRRRSRSPYSARRRSPPPGSNRPRSRSPHSTRQRSISPALHRRRSRSPLSPARQESPSPRRRSARQRSISPALHRRRSRSPLSPARQESPVRHRSRSPHSKRQQNNAPRARSPRRRQRSPSVHHCRSRSPRFTRQMRSPSLRRRRSPSPSSRHPRSRSPMSPDRHRRAARQQSLSPPYRRVRSPSISSPRSPSPVSPVHRRRSPHSSRRRSRSPMRPVRRQRSRTPDAFRGKPQSPPGRQGRSPSISRQRSLSPLSPVVDRSRSRSPYASRQRSSGSPVSAAHGRGISWSPVLQRKRVGSPSPMRQQRSKSPSDRPQASPPAGNRSISPGRRYLRSPQSPPGQVQSPEPGAISSPNDDNEEHGRAALKEQLHREVPSRRGSPRSVTRSPSKHRRGSRSPNTSSTKRRRM